MLRSLGHGQIGRKMVFLLGHCLQARDGIWRSLLYPVLLCIDLQIVFLLSYFCIIANLAIVLLRLFLESVPSSQGTFVNVVVAAILEGLVENSPVAKTVASLIKRTT